MTESTKTITLAWGAKVSKEFREKVVKICKDFGWTPDHADWLMSCMAFESGRTFSPSVKNPHSSATGLIQFMSYTARSLGTTTKKLAAMTAEAQLDYVAKYFKPWHNKITGIEDMYLTILWPKAVGRSLYYVLWATGTRAYAVNRGLDKNRDGKVTKKEAASKVQEQLERGLRAENSAFVEW